MCCWPGHTLHVSRLGEPCVHGCLRSFVQVVEDRFRIWLDNLQFIEEYNSKSTSHWVSVEMTGPGWRRLASSQLVC